MVKIGAHVSAAGSLENSFKKAQEIGADCTQIFISPPQQWLQATHSNEEIERYKTKAAETQIGPNFIHGTYLINLASQNPLNYQKSIDWLIYSQNIAEKLGIGGTIFHIGSSGHMDRQEALKQVIEGISHIMESTGNVNLILETSAGAGNTIGDEFEELSQVVKEASDERIKVCLDTQHIFASGYDISKKEGLEKILEDFDRKISLKKIVAIHLNDSKTELNSHKDRHENIGEGLIGIEAFTNIINHPKLINIPFILEVPGFDQKGPDKENILKLKSLINQN